MSERHLSFVIFWGATFLDSESDLSLRLIVSQVSTITCLLVLKTGDSVRSLQLNDHLLILIMSCFARAFTVVLINGPEERTIPGNALSVHPDLPFRGLEVRSE